MRSVLPMLVFVWAVTYTNTATFAQSVTPAFNSKSLRDAQKGLITQVLTLGSVHLAQVEKKPKAEELDGLLDKLEAFKPDIITLEGLSGEQCDQMERYRALYGRQHAA